MSDQKQSDRSSFEGLKAAADTIKQIIALSTGVIALTITFLEKVLQPLPKEGARTVPWTMLAGWILFGLTILVGLLALGSVVGTLNAIDRKRIGLSLTRKQQKAAEDLAGGKSDVRKLAFYTYVLFFLGIVLTIATGFEVSQSV